MDRGLLAVIGLMRTLDHLQSFTCARDELSSHRILIVRKPSSPAVGYGAFKELHADSCIPDCNGKRDDRRCVIPPPGVRAAVIGIAGVIFACAVGSDLYD